MKGLNVLAAFLGGAFIDYLHKFSIDVFRK